MQDTIIQILLAFIAKYPLASSLFMIMGVLRAVFKPLVTAARAYVESTPGLGDDEKLDGIMGSSAYKAVAFELDFVASIKLPGTK